MYFLQRKKVIIATSNLCLLGGVLVSMQVMQKYAFDTSVLKVWEIELTTIISDGSRTMHSHPRRRLPADRFPKLEKGGKREILNLYLKPAELSLIQAAHRQLKTLKYKS